MILFSSQLVDIFGPLIERPLIKQDFDKNYPEIVERMDKEIMDCKMIYDNAMEASAAPNLKNIIVFLIKCYLYFDMTRHG